MPRIEAKVTKQQAVDLRSAGRQKLILRVGLLEQEGRSIFCLVKNISASGVLVKPYGHLSDAGVSLRVGDEKPIPGTLVWSRDGLAGVRFGQPLNPQALLRIAQKMGATRRRTAPRMTTDLKGSLRTGGTRQGITISDLSMVGARVRTERPVAFGKTTIIDVPGLPSLTACVRWSDGAEFGVSFYPALPIPMVAELLSEDLAADAQQVQGGSTGACELSAGSAGASDVVPVNPTFPGASLTPRRLKRGVPDRPDHMASEAWTGGGR